MFSKFLQRPSACILTVVLLAAAAIGDARAQGSEASELSLLPVAALSSASSNLLVAGAELTVVGVGASAEGAVWVLERAADGARGTLHVAGRATVAVGTSVTVGAMTAGYVLSIAGQAVACIPNAVGAALLYNERVTR